ncbi:MAG: MFS transporter [Thermomicrobiales bacterium]
MRVPTFGLPLAVLPVFYTILFVHGALGAYQPIWPIWIERLDASPALIGFLIAAPGILRIGVVAPSASIAERFGAKRVMLYSRWLILFGYLGAFLATHWVHLLPVLIVMAAVEIIYPVAQAYVARHTTDSERMHAFTLIFNVGPAAALAVGPLLSAAVVAVSGIRFAFVLSLFFTGLAILAIARLRDDQIQMTHEHYGPPSTYRQAVSQRPVFYLLLLQGAVIFALSLGVAFIPNFLDEERGVPDSTIALLASFPAIGSFVFGLVLTRSKAIHRYPMLGAGITVVSTLIAFAMFHQFGDPMILWLAFFLRGGFFSGWVLFISALGEVSSATHRARVFASSEIMGGLTSALGPMLAGILYAFRKPLPFEVAILIGLAILPMLWLVQRRVLSPNARI